MPGESESESENWSHRQLPKSLEDCTNLLEEHIEAVADATPKGEFLRRLYKHVKQKSTDVTRAAKQANPIAFAKLDYEQALKCNSWVWGVSLIIDFDANRKGKTANTIFTSLLNILPNDPSWRMFAPHTDEWGRLVQVLQRPTIAMLQKLRRIFKRNPTLRGDPRLQPWEGENAEKFSVLKEKFPECFKPAFPLPTYSDPEYTGWHGAPDKDYHLQIIMPEWRKWLPKQTITRDSEYDRQLTLTVPHPHGSTEWTIYFKSYESEDTKWSGAATAFILLTEGLKKATLDEVKQRFRVDAWGCWDYTPYEARNTGGKTALAFKVYQGKEEMPLVPFVYSGFGIEKTPDYILPSQKREDQLRMWGNSEQGKARIHGQFFTAAPVALANLDRTFHSVPWTREELFEKFPEGRIYRGLDPGYDHPTVCCWGLLTKANVWFIYRFYSEARKSLGQRCEDIIKASNNTTKKITYGKGDDDYYLVECHPNSDSEIVVATIADYHIFKTDEQTKRPYAVNYTKEGLPLTRSHTYGPKERAQMFDRKLEKSLVHSHPLTRRPPGAKVFFLINEEGVADALDKIENVFWARFAGGNRKDEPKDELQDFEDDELDGASYIVTSPYVWTPEAPKRVAGVDRDEISNIANPRLIRQFRKPSTFATTGY